MSANSSSKIISSGIWIKSFITIMYFLVLSLKRVQHLDLVRYLCGCHLECHNIYIKVLFEYQDKKSFAFCFNQDLMGIFSPIILLNLKTCKTFSILLNVLMQIFSWFVCEIYMPNMCNNIFLYTYALMPLLNNYQNSCMFKVNKYWSWCNFW